MLVEVASPQIQATPTLEYLAPILKEAVWPIFWILVTALWRKDIRKFATALIGIIDRIVKLKIGEHIELVATLPPESAPSLSSGIKERTIRSLQRKTPPQ